MTSTGPVPETSTAPARTPGAPARDAGTVVVVGIGAAGWAGLADPSRAELRAAEVVLGSARQLAMLPDDVPGERIGWPTPLLRALPDLLAAHRERRVCVLASGDPMFHGIGATLARVLGADRLRVLPHPSSVSLAAARLGWPLAQVDVLSLVTAPLAELRPLLHDGRRILVLSAGADTPARVAGLLSECGFPDSRVTVLSQLDGPAESVVTARAGHWPEQPVDPLNVVAVECAGGPAPAIVPGLRDDRYDNDGQLTKREVRAVALSALGPRPGELLWDVGAGAGSIAIEWMRSHRSCRAIAVESEPDRAARITANAARLGVPALRVVPGRAPDALAGLPTPAAVFVGGGLTRDGVLDTCLDALPAGGRLVATAVTVESEAVLAAAYARLGGDLTRIAVHRASPVGTFTGWRAMMPVTLWSVVKP
ncbi:precorrin-6y C5,15-methyltransferase (decarboxylating) subunit CbiE [Mangrovihabitans endophyticus]|uniref:Precorrin-6Y C5,15-methyltransferase n=1 Tax=Mangrovihabitans endophyticus TaxID=1751298 RepID=A0A8J3FT79_9ACTN|nr:precorrin-6y C5,15-methyltransferase (decarboxylating) subunit CbiE [Mangrovihabitans endophyticus]GGL18528.1 precorrin-6Y C5,15-methyltransferase [Mangrovihabitans endophyticus]